jgi:hypothetical protein
VQKIEGTRDVVLVVLQWELVGLSDSFPGL